ncbi:MAG: hypothetical protein HJJLKODD_03022 [Phycisphaerae bacterium]|nr:hypothetical protein [Phycisphaerae bacterium]
MRLVMLGIFLLLIQGCALHLSVDQQLSDSDPLQRIKGIRAVQDSQQELWPRVVDLLDDEDSAVRFYAIMSLEKRFGTRLGYTYSAPSAQRRQYLEAWKSYLSQALGGVSGSSEQKPPEPVVTSSNH